MSKIHLSKYNPSWASDFESEKEFLINIIGSWLFGSVEHVGSTSVPNLMGKPVIDIMFGVESLEGSRPAIEILVENGYCYFPYKEEVMHWFCKPSEAHRTHHLHLVSYKSVLWQERIKFRDILRSNKKISKEYEALKVGLAKAHENERELYTQKKWPFIQRVLARKQC